MLRILMHSIQFWMLAGGGIGAGIDYLIGDPPDWSVGFAVGLLAGGIVGFLVRKMAA